MMMGMKTTTEDLWAVMQSESTIELRRELAGYVKDAKNTTQPEWARANALALVKAIRSELSRRRRNANARARSQAMRDLGMVRTPYGWE